MKKQCTLLLSILLMLAVTSAAYAVPDRETTYMLQTIVRQEKADEYALAAGEDTQPGSGTLQSIYDTVENDKIAPIDWWRLDYFGTSVKAAAQALTAGDVEKMTLCEFVAIDVSEYDPEKYDGEQAVLHLINQYELNLNCVAVVGSLKDDAARRLADGERLDGMDVMELYDWQALRAEPEDDGIRVTFTRDALAMVNQKDAVLAVLCEVMPGTYTEETVKTPGTPSKTVDDFTRITFVGGGEIPNLILRLLLPLNEQEQTECDKLLRFTAAKENVPLDYFGADVRAQAQALLPDTALDALGLSECAGIIAYNYDYRHGEITAEAAFPTPYQAGQSLLAVVGVFRDDGSVIWTAQKAQAADGNVRITFTQNMMTRFEENRALLLIFSESAQ